MKRSSLRSGSLPALAIATTMGFAIVVPGALAQSPDAREQPPVESFRELLELRSAADRAAQLDEGLSEAEVAAAIQLLRETNSEAFKRAETASANDVVGSVSVVARCAEGSIASISIQKSANDVEILSQERVACDESGCKAVQVNARRASQEPFTLVVSVACNG